MDCGYTKKKKNADKKYSQVESNLISQNHRNLQKWGSWYVDVGWFLINTNFPYANISILLSKIA